MSVDIPIKENLTNNDEKDNEEIPLEKPVIGKQTIKKERKPKTPAQLEQFEKVRMKRLDKLKEKKELQKIEASNLLLKNGYVKKEEVKPVDEIKPQKTLDKKIKKEPVDITTDESEAESEIIIVKKKKKPKKKTYVIEESSDDDEEYEINKAKEIYKKSRNMVSQQNKKSIIKVNTPSYHNFFVE
jgi:hypothetical protein